MKDRYDNPLSTQSARARDRYVAGLDLLLAGQVRFVDAFEQAIEADPGFALGHVALARGLQNTGDMTRAGAAMASARDLTAGITEREQSHVHAMDLLISGKTAQAYRAIRAHVDRFPRDALVAQTCSSVFGLIGFSGQPGREAEILAYTAALLPHYGEDWWCLSQYAFALCETGALDPADQCIDRALALNPDNANGAHVRSHIYYEAGEPARGISYLGDWLAGYHREGYLHGHLSWHAALWALEQGEAEVMWARIDADIGPSASAGLPINVLTDTASLLYRAELAGLPVAPERWSEISRYAAQFFPESGLGFVDIHAALAHAMAGNGEAMAKLLEAPNDLTGDLVTPIAAAYLAIARGDWAEAAALLTSAMADHARLGGSRAQRDLLEISLLGALLKLGKDTEARRLLALRRPALDASRLVHGLAAHS
ncbi:tetratricopeptide repeat protein [Dinoroseobacter sp. S76]|uniref:tetratricopeptide repeat protein n=1 Tax=Dinoroseobacter sp. S76 TaxID=3415124 RepID=UPI003C79A3A4